MSVAATDPRLTAANREAKFSEAETLLIEGNEAVQQSPAADREYKQDTLERVVRLYEAWNKPAQAAAWRLKLESSEPKEAERKSASAQEALQ